ncbi:MAG TPA: hypothetical protein VIQ02_06195 [Jiangellaceae bacterium]
MGMLLDSQRAPAVVRDGFALGLGGMYAVVYSVLVRRPDEVLIGYKS